MPLHRRALRACLLALIALAIGGAGGASATIETNDLTAHASAALLTVDAEVAGESLLAPAVVPAGVDADTLGSPQVTATAKNLDGSALAGNVPLDGTLSEASQSARPDNEAPVDAQLLAIPAAPVLDLTVSTASAHARDPEVVCPTGGPFGRATVETAGLTVLDVPDAFILLTLDEPLGGVTYTESVTSLLPVEGQEGRAVESIALSQIDRVTLLGGTPAEFSIEIAAPATLTGVATGAPGGASAVYSSPVVNVTSPDSSNVPDIPLINQTPPDELMTLIDDLTQAVEDVVDETVAPVGIADIGITFGEDNLVVDVADDGTSVEATAAAVRIELTVLDAAQSGGLVSGVIELGRLSVGAEVPVGGYRCPLDPPTVVLDQSVVPAAPVGPDVALPRTGSATPPPTVVLAGLAGVAFAAMRRLLR